MPADSDSRAETLSRLLQQAAGGNAGAYAELYQQTSSRLFAVCLRMLRDRGAAEDVLQEVWVTIWQRAASYDPAKSAAMTWLSTLTRNKAIDRLRKRSEEPLRDPDAFPEVVGDLPGPVQMAQRSQAHERLNACLEQLEEQRREVVREAFFTGATYKEMAERLQVPLGTMKSWIRRSLLQLRSCLDS